MKQWLLTLRQILLVSTWIFPFVSFAQTSFHYKKGIEYLNDSKLNLALDYLKESRHNAQIHSQQYEAVIAGIRIVEVQNKLGSFSDALISANDVESEVSAYFPDSLALPAELEFLTSETLLNLGRNEEAVVKMRSSLQRFEKIDANSKNTAKCYKGLGVLYWNSGNTRLAEDYLLSALKIKNKEILNNDPFWADIYNNLGLVYGTENKFKAILNYKKALSIYQKALGETNAKVCNTLINLAMVDFNSGNYNSSLGYFERVSGIYDQLYSGDHPSKAFLLTSIGRVYSGQKLYDRAIIYLQDALKMYIKLFGNKHPEVANGYSLIGQAYAKKGEFKEALYHHQQSIYANLPDQYFIDIYDNPKLDNYYNADVLLSSLRFKAEVFEYYHLNKTLKKRDIDHALTSLDLCDQLIRQIQELRLSEEDKISLGKVSAQVYEDAIRLCVFMSERTLRPNKYLQRAFYFMERSKASVLLSAINDTKAKQFAGLPTETLLKEEQLKTMVTDLKLELSEKSGSSEETRLRQQVLQLEEEYRTFISSLEQEYPEYYKLKHTSKLITLEAVQQSLKGDEALVSYFLANDHPTMYVLLVTKKSIKLYDVDTDGHIEKEVLALRNAIKYRSERHITKLSRSLGELLIPFKIPKYISRLSLLPEGVLSMLPFEILIKENSYLVQNQSISYDYSATLMFDANRQINDNGVNKGNKALLVAPINFDHVGMETLPGTEEEVKELETILTKHGGSVNAKMHNDALEILFQDDHIKQYDYVHLATHGVVDQVRPELSKVFMSTGDSIDDGNLYVSEIYNLSIPAKLVCLSACETGLGKLSKGEGLIGLSRAFKYAGAENIVVSLWSVSDLSTSKLMVDFYKHHLEANGQYSFKESLRQAKLTLLNSENYSSPYYWAPFILVGN